MEGFSLDSTQRDDDWCDLDPACTSARVLNMSDMFAAQAINESNTTASCVIPLCPRILSYTINGTR